MNASIRKFLKEEDGVTALEYGLLAAVIAGILIVVAREQITLFFTTLFTRLQAIATDASSAA
ncbi:MAG: Flp family type IVb pilin [Stenotrophomonas sp.]